MRQQKIGDAFVGVDLILDAREAVAFVFVNLVINRPATLLDGVDHLLRFLFGAARIVPSGEQEQGRFDLIDEVDGRAVFV